MASRILVHSYPFGSVIAGSRHGWGAGGCEQTLPFGAAESICIPSAAIERGGHRNDFDEREPRDS